MARQRIERDDSELKYTRSQTRSNATQTHAILRQRPHRFYGSARIGIPVGVPVGSGAAALDCGTAIACTEMGFIASVLAEQITIVVPFAAWRAVSLGDEPTSARDRS